MNIFLGVLAGNPGSHLTVVHLLPEIPLCLNPSTVGAPALGATRNRRVMQKRRISLIWAPGLFSLIVALFLGCSDDGTGPKSELEPLVGTWRAQVLILTNSANPDVSVDLIQAGATFTLSILATGQYSASLAAFGAANTEVGEVTVSGNQITIKPISPEGPALVATFFFQGTTLVLDGTSEYDFNQDGLPEAAQAHIELSPI